MWMLVYEKHTSLLKKSVKLFKIKYSNGGFRSNSIRGSKCVRFSFFVLATCAVIFMLRTSSDFYAKENQEKD